MKNAPMKRVFLALMTAGGLVLAGCALNAPDGYVYPGFPHPETFTSTLDVIGWVSQHIVYKTDWEAWGYPDYWQTPSQTYTKRTGDCEDFALLAMYLMHTAGIDSHLVLIDVRENGITSLHAYVRDVETGAMIDPQDGSYISADDIEEISYEDAQYRAATSHH